MKVDLGDRARGGMAARGYVEWRVDPSRPVLESAGIRLRLAPAGSKNLETGVYKPGIDSGALMACDGVIGATGSAGAALELVVSGLSPGRHTIATFHNLTEGGDGPPAPLAISVDGKVAVRSLVPTVRATDDADVASAFLEVDAVEGRDVSIAFSHASGAAGIVPLNGIEFDLANPTLRARKPFPPDGDEHVDADTGSLKLAWRAAPAAVSHQVYFANDQAAVMSADPSGPAFRGNVTSSEFPLSAVDRAKAGYWRVDEVDQNGRLTRGEVWSFRPRRLAFPMAEGYGRFARGGRGGRVIKVTNLDDAGPGSLRAAVEAQGPRTVVFDVSGLITLESRLIIRNDDLTIAGQTAPGQGICLRKYNLGMLGAEDVIVRYLRVRPGNLSGTTLDGMGMASSDHCIIDHCSISWTLDEAFSSRGGKNITFQRNLISEALNEAGHKKYPPGTQHGYAASIGGDIGSFHHNLLAHNAGRNWSMAGGLDNSGAYAGRLDLRNNVVYNWKSRATDGGAHEVNFVGNYYKPGPATAFFHALNAQYGGFPGSQRYFFEGNIMEGRFGVDDQEKGRKASTERGGSIPTAYSPWSDKPFFEPFVTTHSAESAYTNVLGNVGCNFPALDDHDRRVIQEVREGSFKFKGSKTGLPGLPDSQEDVGGWDVYPEVHRPAGWDTDQDGMPDEWERKAGLDPKNPADGNADRDGDGYTNLEEYLGWLVGEFPAPVPAGK